MRRAGKVVSRAELLDSGVGRRVRGRLNVVDVYIKYLRDKIDRRYGLELLRTVRGAGYCLGPESEPGTRLATMPRPIGSAERKTETPEAPDPGRAGDQQ